MGKVSNLEGILRNAFAYSIADSAANADNKLKSLGVKDGLAGISFEGSNITKSDITISAKYTVELQFAFFGKKDIEMNKTASCKAFAKVSEDNSIASSTEE